MIKKLIGVLFILMCPILFGAPLISYFGNMNSLTEDTQLIIYCIYFVVWSAIFQFWYIANIKELSW